MRIPAFLTRSLLIPSALLGGSFHELRADIPLIGRNLPGKSLIDGDFDTIMSGWRAAKQSPHWTARHVPGKGTNQMGLAEGRLSGGGNAIAEYDSERLDQNPDYPEAAEGDVLEWRVAARAEYPSDAAIGVALVFGEQVRVLADRKPVPGGNVGNEILEGTYTLSGEDAGIAAKEGFLLRLTLYSSHQVKTYVDYVDLKVLRPESAGPASLKLEPVDEGVRISWEGSSTGSKYSVYRSSEERKGYHRIATGIEAGNFVDREAVNGQTNFYFVTRSGDKESSASPTVSVRKLDEVAPDPPHDLKARSTDATIRLSWSSDGNDIASYNVLRGEEAGGELTRIAKGIEKPWYTDNLPLKGKTNTYAIEAVDFSGNVSGPSKPTAAKVRAVAGASFSDLILPMPIHKQLRSDLWGADDVLPRDPDNGIEDSTWSYWGGKVIKDPTDGKYHLLVVRWPEADRKGHWAWPESTVAHAVSENPTGPFIVKEDIAYSYKNGLGHNANIIPLNDGRFALYSLINWKACILISDTMNGPWTYKGEIKVNNDKSDPLAYRFLRNLSGIQCEDGSFLFVTKAGAMMRSRDGILGPYEPLTKAVGSNTTIPEEYRKSNYEDPTMWYDGVQYHMLINAFLEYRAIYLRSPDGVHWKYETGFAYTPASTVYEDGTRTSWYKLERPNVLQDEFGRATHLSLAAIDVVKDLDYGGDKHSAKHLVLPLRVYKRIEMLNQSPVNSKTERIELLLHSEPGFDPQQDLDPDSLRFGASEEVNFGRGSRVRATRDHAEGLVIEFDGAGNGLGDRNFVGKLIGRTKGGELIVGYSKLAAGN